MRGAKVPRTLAGVGLGAMIALGGSGIAAAAPATEIVQGQYLRIVSAADWQAASHLGAGAAVPWDLSISADAPEPGRISIGVRATGGTPLLVDVLQCAQAWQTGGCASGAVTLRTGWELPRDGSLTPLLSMADTEVAHLRLVVALGGGAAGSPTSVQVQADGTADMVIAGPGGELIAETGLDAALPQLLAIGAVVLVLIATLMIVTGRRRSGSDGGES